MVGPYTKILILSTNPIALALYSISNLLGSDYLVYRLLLLLTMFRLEIKFLAKFWLKSNSLSFISK